MPHQVSYTQACAHFVKALRDYQEATRDVCVSVAQMTDQSVTVLESLSTITNTANDLTNQTCTTD